MQGAQGAQSAEDAEGAQGVEGAEGAEGAEGTQGAQGVEGAEGAQGVQMSMDQMMRDKMSFWASLMESTSGVTRSSEGRVNCTDGTYQEFKCRSELIDLRTKEIKILYIILFSGIKFIVKRKNYKLQCNWSITLISLKL